MANLYALLIGINDYPVPIKQLGGCINDVDRFTEFLESNQGGKFKLKIKRLLDKEATKRNIVEAIQEHLGQAGPGDAALFYYSGHGTQEDADPVFHTAETDKQLECLVCWDSRQPGSSLLADKELRYLLYPVAASGAHLVTIFDCCHSGDNTRGDMTERMANKVPGIRNWEDFIFHDALSKENIANASSLEEILPMGNYIHLTACKDQEVAYESEKSGIFTAAFLNALKYSNGGISYSELSNRVRLGINRNKFPQTPQVNAYGAHPEWIHQAFLGGAIAEKKLQGNIFYNDEKGWLLDLGFIHGIPPLGQTVQMTIKVRKDEKSDFVEPTLEKVYPDSSKVTFDHRIDWDKSKTYTAFIDGFFQTPLNVCCTGDEVGAQIARALLDKAAAGLKQFNICKVDETPTANYMISARKIDGKAAYVLTRWPGKDDPKTDTHIQVSNPVFGYNERSLNNITRQLKHIQRWRMVNNLENPEQIGLPLQLEFTQYIDGKECPITFQENETTIYFEEDTVGKLTGYMRIKVTNLSTHPIHVALLYLSQDFMIYPLMFREGVKKLEPGQCVYAFEGKTNDAKIKLKWEKYVGEFGLKYSTSYFRFIYSYDDFSVNSLTQQGLIDFEATRAGIEIPTRSDQEGLDYPESEHWGTTMLTVKMRKPPKQPNSGSSEYRRTAIV